MTRRYPSSRRAGVTLIEILVVIAIIAILIGMLLPALQKVRSTVRRATAQSEMAQVGTAIANFKTKFGVDYIPAFGSAPTTGYFRVRAFYYDPVNPPATLPANAVPSTSPEAVYLKRLFPQLPPLYVGGAPTNGFTTGLTPVTQEGDLDPNQTLVLFLTGGGLTNYQGFSNNKQAPFTPPSAAGETRIGPFLNDKATKFDANAHYLDPWGTPYAYFSVDAGNTYPNIGWTTTTGDILFPYRDSSTKFLMPKGYQLVSAGADMRFGTNTAPPSPSVGVWTPGNGVWLTGKFGGDDLSNFNGTVLAYQE